MNCWKSINLAKDFGRNRLLLMSSLITLFSFILLYVSITIAQGSTAEVSEAGIIPFLLLLLLLPTIHSSMHILPLILMNRRMKIIFKLKNGCFPVFYYYTKYHLTKKAYFIVALAPTILLTIPGVVASYYFNNYSVYILLLTSANIGIAFIDLLYISYLWKAPKQSVIESSEDGNGLDILIQGHEQARI
ncbi:MULTISPECIES: DUF3267 domain-containing protein [Virgibacillus]|uniref:Zincin peptidase n=1 Tax=Virgibacillus pantothenticus TaxID=1473 RepID=A0A0L0QUT7_VIRPA|nr:MULTISPECIES: DUF3267 domain-containing protein [Virgibacillus]API91086.1 hypothetical protein BKP57_03950 [Virgibacillus sp. 6R]KNE21958.1 hypothetical protein AFK71_03920 [Virgibacillus pantothenticus]MBS7429076.1 DUF3267 domain-containing protein [Virgibacillus sp. 19R1-5]MBU8566901.1 DUF3267 domain-containing protein [Virgibacillus pantothenticus]MBU8600406.1 DUF3267 domain-containing protein [Virgibacillus pantothenticus]